jgi:tetratricopeptide (TPR) repeat protein
VLDRTTARCRGDWTSAYASARRMAELAPASSDARATVGFAAMYLYRADEALGVFQSTLRGAGGVRHDPNTYRSIGMALHMLGRFAEERALGDRIEREFPGSPAAYTVRLQAAAALGDTAAALRIVEQLTALPIGTDVDVASVIVGRVRTSMSVTGHAAARRRAFELLARRFESTPADRRERERLVRRMAGLRRAGAVGTRRAPRRTRSGTAGGAARTIAASSRPTRGARPRRSATSRSCSR